MNQHAWTVLFGPVDVRAMSREKAVEAAATLLRENPDFYVQVALLEEDMNGTIADTPPDQRTTTI